MKPYCAVFCQNEHFADSSKKTLEKLKLTFSGSALFQVKSRVSLISFVTDCSFFAACHYILVQYSAIRKKNKTYFILSKAYKKSCFKFQNKHFPKHIGPVAN